MKHAVLLVWTVFAALCSLTTSARATLNDHFIITLDAESVDRPEYVCVVTDHKPLKGNWVALDTIGQELVDPRLKVDPDVGRTGYTVPVLSDSLAATMTDGTGKATDSAAFRAFKAMSDASKASLCNGPQEGSPGALRPYPCQAVIDWEQAGVKPPERPDAPAQANKAPPAKPEASRPKRFMSCRANSPGHGAPVAADTLGRALVVYVRFVSADTPSANSVVEDFTLFANVIDVHLHSGFDPKDEAEALVIGGHYEPSDAVVSKDDRIDMRLVPICKTHFVKIPPFVPRPGDAGGFGASVSTVSPSSLGVCKNAPLQFDDSGRAAVSLPYSRNEATTELRVTNGPSEFRASWSGPTAPETLTLRATAVSFSWTRPCLATLSDCPTAAISDVGVACKRTGPGCTYTCGGRGDARSSSTITDFDVPTNVHFSDSENNTWAVKLGYSNQALEGHVAPSEHSVGIDFTTWGDADALRARPWERIEYVEIKAPGGAVIRALPTTGIQRLRVPGITCLDYIGYRIVGDRTYQDRTVQVRDGMIHLESPKELLTDYVTFSFAIGGGVYTPWGSPITNPVLPFGVAEVITSVRFLPTSAVGYTDLFIARPWFELRGGDIFTGQWYVGVAAPGQSGKTSVPYNRFFLTALAQFPLSETIFAGIGPGLAYGAAFFSQDSSVVGAPQVSFTPVIDVGTRPGQGPFALEGALRLFVYERLEQFETDFRSTPVRHDIKQYPWFLELKLRVGR